MARLPHILILLAFVQSCQLKGQQEENINGEKLLEEIRDLKVQLVDYHSGLYWFTSDREFEENFGKLEATVADGMDLPGYYREISEFIGTIHCGHTRVRVPGDLRDYVEREGKLMPFSVVIRSGQVFIDKIFGNNELKRGDKILEVNGMPIESVLTTLRNRLPGDGYIKTGKDNLLKHSWPFQYAFLVDHKAETFELKLTDETGARSVEIAGITYVELQEFSKTTSISDNPLLELNYEHSTSTAIIRIRTFSSGSLSGYREFLEESFTGINELEMKNVILDLRGNGGGRDEYGALLVSYFADRPFGYFESIEVTDRYEGYGGVISENGKRWVTAHSGLSIQQPAERRFKGDAYVIIDGGCFSTCGDVASVMKINRFATLVGEETGGGAYGNTSGNSGTFVGKHTGLRISIPYWKYSTANIPDSLHGRGVIPDYPLESTYRSLEKDVFMDFVIEKLIEKN